MKMGRFLILLFLVINYGSLSANESLARRQVEKCHVSKRVIPISSNDSISENVSQSQLANSTIHVNGESNSIQIATIEDTLNRPLPNHTSSANLVTVNGKNNSVTIILSGSNGKTKVDQNGNSNQIDIKQKNIKTNQKH